MNKQQANQLIKSVNQLKQQKKTRRPKRKAKSSLSSCCLSPCAQKFLRAREDPFSMTASCVPTANNTPSLKSVIKSRGTFITGDSGFGSVQLAPWLMSYNDGEFGDNKPAPPVIFTTADYNDSKFPVAGTAGTAYGNSNSGYSSFNYTNKVLASRLVGAGLRVRNVTPMMYRGGTLVGVETVSHLQLQGQTQSDIYRNSSAGDCDINGGWSSVVWHAIDDDDYDFLRAFPTNIQANDALAPVNRYCLGFAAQCSTEQVYEWEAIASFEIVGTSVYSSTPSPSDPIGMGIIQDIASSVNLRKPHTGERHNLVSQLLNAAGPYILKGISGFAVSQANNYFGQRRQISQSSRVNPSLMIEEID